MGGRGRQVDKMNDLMRATNEAAKLPRTCRQKMISSAMCHNTGDSVILKRFFVGGRGGTSATAMAKLFYSHSSPAI